MSIKENDLEKKEAECESHISFVLREIVNHFKIIYFCFQTVLPLGSLAQISFLITDGNTVTLILIRYYLFFRYVGTEKKTTEIDRSLSNALSKETIDFK